MANEVARFSGRQKDEPTKGEVRQREARRWRSGWIALRYLEENPAACGALGRAGGGWSGRTGVYECRSFVQLDSSIEPLEPGVVSIFSDTGGHLAWRQRLSFFQNRPRLLFFSQLPARHREHRAGVGMNPNRRPIQDGLTPCGSLRVMRLPIFRKSFEHSKVRHGPFIFSSFGHWQVGEAVDEVGFRPGVRKKKTGLGHLISDVENVGVRPSLEKR